MYIEKKLYERIQSTFSTENKYYIEKLSRTFFKKVIKIFYIPISSKFKKKQIDGIFN